MSQHIEKCDVCQAPYRYPLTSRAVREGWTYTEHAVGMMRVVMTHRPDCPAADRVTLIGRPA